MIELLLYIIIKGSTLITLVMTKFILLSTQRSGSTWVIDMLNSHPEIVAYSELLMKKANGTNPKWGGSNEKQFWETYISKLNKGNISKEIFYSYLDNVFEDANNIKSIGFKVMYDQANYHPWLMEYLKLNKVYIIHLIRKNLLDIIISKKLAAQSNIYHTYSPTKPLDKITLDTSELVMKLERKERDIQNASIKYSELNLPYIEIEYEELKKDTSRFSYILKLLDVQIQSLNSNLQIVNNRSKEQIIDNYTEVHDLLKHTKYIAMLNSNIID